MMSMNALNLIFSALSQGMIYAPMALGVYVAFRVLNTPDLTIDGSFVAGMCVCAVVTIAGHPLLALLCGLLAGALAGLVTGLLQTKVGINAILSVNSAGVETQVSSETLYKSFRALLVRLTGNRQFDANLSALIVTALIVALAAAALAVFFLTRTGMAIRATGDNEEMVRSSSINADRSRLLGIMISNALVAFSGALLCDACAAAMLTASIAELVMMNRAHNEYASRPVPFFDGKEDAA